MAATVKWLIKLYDKGGNPYDIDYSDYVFNGDASTNEVLFASSRSLTYYLNGVDECEFTIALDDPAAYKIRRLKTFVKIFRVIDDPEREISIVGSNPSFCGVVGVTNKSGAANSMTVKAFNPLWKLQFRFHLLNHYLELNPDTGDNYTQSELMWKLIDLINNAFGSASYTGIDRGTFEWGLPDEPQVAPYFVAKGSKTWSLIFDDIMNRPAGVDIFPVYTHADGDPTLMQLNTMEKRGLDKSAALKFNYHTPADGALIDRPNLDDLTEEAAANPDQFANYVWVVGQGGPNSGKVAARLNSSAAVNSDGYREVGIYMAYVEQSEVKRLSALGPIADADLKTMKHPQDAYTVSVSPSGSLYYDYDFVLGDVCSLNADRGALQVTNKKQRIYQVTLRMSDNNLETPECLLSNDFFGKVTGETSVEETPADVETGGGEIPTPPAPFSGTLTDVTITGDTTEGSILTAVPS